MFEDIIALVAGLISGYLVIRLVRSFRGGVGIVLLGLGCSQAEAANYGWTATNGCASTVQMRAYFDGTSRAYTDVAAGAAWQYYSSWGSVPSITIGISTNGGSTYSETLGPVTGILNEYPYVGTSSCGPTVTYAYACFGPYTNVQSCSIGIRFYATNSTTHVDFQTPSRQMLPGDVMPSMCVTNVLGTDGNGSGYSFDWQLIRSGCIEDDYMPKVIDSGGSSNTPGTYGTPDVPPPPVNPGDPGGQTPPPYNTNYSGDQNLHNDITELSRLTSKEAKQDQQLSAQLTANGLLSTIASNGTNGNGTNYMDVLNRIKTNTFNTADQVQLGFSGMSTGLFGYWQTNQNGDPTNFVPGTQSQIVSNTAVASSGVISNQFVTNGGPGGWQGSTNGFNTNWAGHMGQLTNGQTLWGSSVTPPGEDPMGVTIGTPGKTQKTLTLSLNRMLSGLCASIVTRVMGYGPWLRFWLSWAITAALFWACVGRIDDHLKALQIGGIMAQKPAGAAQMLVYGIKMSLGTLISTVITALIAILPTAAIAWMSNHGIGNPLSATGFVESFTTLDSGPAAVFAEYFGMLDIWVPFDVLMAALWTWGIFYFSVSYWFGLSCMALRFAGMMVPCLVFGLFCVWQTDDVQAAELRLENLSGSSVVCSQAQMVVTFPTGLSRLELDAGPWACGTNGFTMPGDSVHQWAVRAWGDTNLPGQVVFTEEEGTGAFDWYLVGFNLGLTISAFAWSVSAARSGFLLRMRE